MKKLGGKDQRGKDREERGTILRLPCAKDQGEQDLPAYCLELTHIWHKSDHRLSHQDSILNSLSTLFYETSRKFLWKCCRRRQRLLPFVKQVCLYLATSTVNDEIVSQRFQQCFGDYKAPLCIHFVRSLTMFSQTVLLSLRLLSVILACHTDPCTDKFIFFHT